MPRKHLLLLPASLMPSRAPAELDSGATQGGLLLGEAQAEEPLELRFRSWGTEG